MIIELYTKGLFKLSKTEINVFVNCNKVLLNFLFELLFFNNAFISMQNRTAEIKNNNTKNMYVINF